MLAAAILPMALLAAAAWKDQKPWRAEAAGRSAGAGQAAAATGVTHVAITDTVVQPVVERLGMNMGEESYFDSSMLLKNLVARNPGFEGGSYQTILRCLHADVTRCADDDTESVWPQDFWRGAAYEWITGPLEGHKGSVGGSSAAVHGSAGAVLQLGGAMAAVPRAAAGPAYLVVRKAMPGDATAGWWPQTQGGATMTTEFHDLSPHTAGKQALRMSAAGAGESATLIAYFDTMEGRTFLRMHGKYRLSFRAKAVSGSGVRVEIERISQPAARFMAQEVPLAGQWQDLHVDLTAKDAVNADGTPAIGPVKLAFAAVNATVLLDDVRLEAVAGEAVNKTVFRDEVVDALRAYHPGVLRFMASSTGLGSSVANMLAAPEARVRAGYSPWQAEQTDVGYGLPDFLQLCATIHADPWVVVPAGASVREMRELVEYLAATWSGKFGRIHLELGNETWNGAYKGESIEYPEDYGHRVAVMFRAARQSKGFDAKKFDLIAGGQAAWAGRNKDILMHADGAMDSMAIAPYLLHDVPAGASTDAIFGALFAEAEQMSAGGQIAQNIAAVKPAALEIYETNLHTTEGSPTQATLNAVVPSIGAGVAVVSEMLQAMRAGVRSQAMFTLGQWSYKRNDGLQVPLWGTVVDMGVTNRRRPQFLAGALVNTAAHGVMVGTQQSGENPVWNESSGIDGVSLQNAHALQSFAFRDGAKRAVVLINLSRSAALAVDFTGAVQPVGRVDVREMTAAKITDSNEDAERVKVTSSGMVFKPGQRVVVPAFSVMVLKWSAGR
jgi:hypothetical protein